MTSNELGRTIVERWSRGLVLWILVGGSLVAASAFADSKTTWTGVLVAALWGISIAIGAGVFISLNGVAAGRWWIGLHRCAGALTEMLVAPLLALAFVFALGFRSVYPAASSVVGAHGPAFSHAKLLWLSPTFVIGRAVVIALVWLGALSIMRRAVANFASEPTLETQRRFAKLSALFLVLLGPTISLAFFDWGMSVEPEWYSTIYGFYGFAASFQGGIAAIAALGLLSKAPAMQDPERRHNLGKLLFGFSVFWAYIWFSQFMLIWYANLPEETSYYVRRLSGDWLILFWINVGLNFVIPFFALLSAKAKRNPVILLQVSIAVLAGRWLDMYLLIAPAKGPLATLPYGAIGATLATIAGMTLLLGRSLQSGTSRTAANRDGRGLAEPNQA